jgi:hypothetical protein
MINSGMQNDCIKRMKDIIAVYGEVSNLIHVSEENFENTLLKIADIKLKPNITVKQALCNLEKYRPEVRSAFELQLFNVWYDAFKTLDVGYKETELIPLAVEGVVEVEEMVEESIVIEEPETEVEEIPEEPAVMEDIEPEVEEIPEEPAVMEDIEPEAEEILEEPAVMEDIETEAEEILEELSVIEEPEPEVEEILEEPAVMEDIEPESEEIPEEPEPMENERKMNSFKEDEQEVVEKKLESSEQSLDQDDETEEVYLKKHKRDWFDFLLDCSGVLMQFLIRILSRKRS